MTVTANVADAPPLDGFEPVEIIGAGGFSTVYLYRQVMPSRNVAVKVLKATISDLGNLASEANLMAAIEHQFIVPVYTAPISEDGRLCLVMKYFAGSDYSQQLKRAKFSVPDVVRTGIQLAGAIEAAHRIGVLHRDIKPANILSDGRRPVLTDFGISAVLGDSENVGYSPPWAPPEAFLDGVLDERSDIYSLAATLYTLLCARSPFESSTESNSTDDLGRRIVNNPVPPTGIAAVPPALERVLRLAMSKRAADRPATAADFGRQLQRVESELRLAQTPLDFGSAAGGPQGVAADLEPETRVAPAARSGAAHSPRRPTPAALPKEAPDSEQRERPRFVTIALGTVAVAIAAIGLFFLLPSGSDGATSPPTDRDVGVAVNDNLGDVATAPRPPSDVTATDNGDGTFSFEWSAVPDVASYRVRPAGSDVFESVTEPQFRGATACIMIRSVGTNSLISLDVETCA